MSLSVFFTLTYTAITILYSLSALAIELINAFYVLIIEATAHYHIAGTTNCCLLDANQLWEQDRHVLVPGM